MSFTRNVALSLTMMLAMPGAAGARPLPVDDLAALSERVSPELLLRLAERRGLDRPLDGDDRAALLDVGLGPELVDRLALLAMPAVQVDGVAYAVVDGVIRVRAEGPEPAIPATRPADEGEAAAEWPAEADERSLGQEAPQGEQLPALSPTSAVLGWSNPYPLGAHGATVGAVFVPARFGGTPSAFGRTIVSTWSGSEGACCSPWASGGGIVAPGTPVVDGQVRANARTDNFIPLRTSRGTLWVPN